MEAIEDLPPRVRQSLTLVVEAAQGCFGPALTSAVLFGSAAEGRLRASSDINLLLVLAEFDRDKVDGFRDAYRMAHASVRLKIMFLLESELGQVTEVFAVKFTDILLRRRVLLGRDPIAGLVLPRQAIAQHIRQMLVTLILSLRERYTLMSLREEQLGSVIAEAAAPLRSCAAAILLLEEHPAASPREALERIVRGFGEAVWEEVLQAFPTARQHLPFRPGVAPTVLYSLIAIAERLRLRAEALA